jgi:YD repeat-containing protein
MSDRDDYTNGTTTTYAYNKANLVTSVLNKKGTTTLSSHTYTYYLDGNIASETVNSVETTYEYDGLGRLTKETKNGTITMYTYDANGNRATMTQNNVTTTYTYDANNRLTAETAAGVATTYTYDNNGNLINAWNGGNPVAAYAYNLFGKAQKEEYGKYV